MNGVLNTGKGRCRGAACLSVVPTLMAIDLGAEEDFLTGILKAVHHANRNGDPDDFIAVTLPDMHVVQGSVLPGNAITLVGSSTSLSKLVELNTVKALVHRRIVPDLKIRKISPDIDENGMAFVRDRSLEKRGKGWMRRNVARSTRRGHVWKDAPARSEHDILCLRYGKLILYVRRIIGKITNEPLMVSTYGFSSPSMNFPAILPVVPRE